MFFDPAYPSLKNGLVGYWSPVATGATGLQLLDLSGQNNHGTLTNMDAPTDWVDSPYGKVLDFDGVNDHVNLGTFYSRFVQRFTISAWVLNKTAPSVNSSKIILGWGNDNIASQGIFLKVDNSSGTIAYLLQKNQSGSNSIVTVLPQFQLWTHLVLICVDATVIFYTNDVLNLQQTFGSTVQSGSSFFLGGRGANQPCDMQVADTCMWNRVLERTEIQQLYNLGPKGFVNTKPNVSVAKRKWWPSVKTPKPRPIIPTQRGIKSGPIFYDPKAAWLKNGLVGHWCPSATSPTGTQLLDLSGQDNNGTLTNMASATSWVQSGGKGALSFDRVNDQIPTTCPGITTNSRSCAVWFNSSVVLANAQYAPLLRWGTATTFPADAGKDFSVQFGNDANFGSTGLGISQYGDGFGVTGFNDGRWHFGYFESVGNVYSIWIDGVFRASKTMTTNATAGTVTIGQTYGFFYGGELDDIRLYNRALTPSEIAELYAGGRGYGVSNKPYRRSSYSPAPKKIFKSRIDRKRSVSLVHPDHDNEWVTNGLVGFWCPSLTGATGTQLLDLSGQNNNGTLTNMDAPTDWVQSPYGNALDFDGLDDRVSAIVPTVGVTSLSISAWVFFNSIPASGFTAEILGKWGNSTAFDSTDAFTLNAGNGQGLRFFIGGPNLGVTTGSPAITTNTWYHIAAVWSQNTGRIFVQGIQQVSGTITSSTMNQAASTEIRIGKSSSNAGADVAFSGRIAGVSLWLNRALSTGEVQTLYQLGPRMGFSRSPSRSPTWMVEADETIGNRRRRIICGGKN